MRDPLCPATHYMAFKELKFFVEGFFDFNLSAEINPAILFMLVESVEKRFPWHSMCYSPQVRGPRLAQPMQLDCGWWRIVCSPIETLLSESQLPAYSRFLRTLAYELAKLDIPGIRAVNISMHLNTPMSTYSTPSASKERQRQMGERLPEATNGNLMP
jgi:hypothetical protein